ncbi:MULTISPECIES: gephyrin-like molybdotransferase Glp [Pseudomonas]|jgi:molybdopterin molybdotransferase|uniref:Molybdopterin molybdenumtransferase n=1 Tax=Pseudomonas rhizophila TaxID=2045200 RepID=A0ABM6UH42_9PSED|nr:MULTISPECIES: gephyrin-like molybdotransferase Glp [Pseudomonas]AVU76767.1 molybdopterin molybdenumtransferase MoeA [Pseudomonas rhizophila]MBD0701739.1 molybdopterin molybdenumtransferase MoeA [Pseudomonas sp. PSB1]MDD2030328.1 molybdopterin molybdotransferase MoeA [Pseudomonas sp. 39167]MXR30212.1 molybdopterin molybdenumtransferase MoeA [Pseudomonas sp. PICF6]QKJ35897.1 molybdopterin molybdotransferase MoeA [Pseudomonas sp. MPDS]
MSSGACGSVCESGALMPVDEAIRYLLDQAPLPPPVQRVALDQALGRVLATDIRSPMNLPAWDNSAMDGYALRAADLPAAGGYLTLAGRIAAGQASNNPLQPGQAVRIFTGAPLPPGADTVVPQESCRVAGERVWLPPVNDGDHVRKEGEEVRRGDLLLRAGKRLRAQELGLLAGAGIARMEVYRPLQVGLLSSGDELREPGEALAPGQIYNSNRHSLAALLRGWGMEVHDYGAMPDKLLASRQALSLAAAECDVLLTSGGVSVGEEDHLKQAIEALGSVDLWRLAIQPGKPLAFGEVAGKPWIGLPGNPSAALITALIVVRPFLFRAQGMDEVLPISLQLPAGFDWPKPNRRRQYLRAKLVPGADGSLCVELHPQQSSAMLAAACWADGLAVVECQAHVRMLDKVMYLPFASLMH